jgi:hypothetical protein
MKNLSLNHNINFGVTKYNKIKILVFVLNCFLNKKFFIKN